MAATQEKVKMPSSPFGRASFPELVIPTAMEDGAKKKYSLVLLFPTDKETLDRTKAMGDKANLDEMRKLVDAEIAKAWPKGAPKNLRLPFNDAGDKDYDGYKEGDIAVRFSSGKKPRVVGQDKADLVPDMNTEEYPDLYGGCWARVSYNVYAYGKGAYGKESKFAPGVSFGLGNVQKVMDDSHFGGGHSDPNEDFDEVEIDDAAGLLD